MATDAVQADQSLRERSRATWRDVLRGSVAIAMPHDYLVRRHGLRQLNQRIWPQSACLDSLSKVEQDLGALFVSDPPLSPVSH